MQEKHIEDLIVKFVKEGDVVSIGTSKLGEMFLKKLALALEETHIPIYNIEFVPTSLRLAEIASSLKIPITSINEKEVDIAIEFADMVDDDFNYVKRHSTSLVRDKMIAQSAGILIIIADETAFVKRIRGKIPFEIASFGWKRTVNQLDNFGKARLREENGKPFKSETGHYFVDVDVDKIFSYEDLEFDSKNIPGVLETGLFLGYADKVIISGKNIQILSRTDFK